MPNLLSSEGNLTSNSIALLFGEGLTVPTYDGSRSFIITDNPNRVASDRTVISDHEFGHGIASNRGASAEANNINSIRTENLTRRLKGLPENSGVSHGTIPEPNELPLQ